MVSSPKMAASGEFGLRQLFGAFFSSVPLAKKAGQRGGLAHYGHEAIEPAKRAGQGQGWQQGTFYLNGNEQHKTYKTFVRTYRPPGVLIRWCWSRRRRPGWCSSAPM